MKLLANSRKLLVLMVIIFKPCALGSNAVKVHF